MTLDYIRLTVPCDFGGGIGQVDTVFEMPYGNQTSPFTVADAVRTGFLVDLGSTELGWLYGLLANGKSKRESITLDVGGGQHAIDLQGTLPAGDDAYQWGYSSNSGDLDEATATGGTPEQQQFVFNNTLTTATPDSASPATLEVFEYSSSGLGAPLDVVVEEPRVELHQEQPSTGSVQFTAVTTATLSDALDLTVQNDH